MTYTFWHYILSLLSVTNIAQTNEFPTKGMTPGSRHQVARAFEVLDHSMFFSCYRYLTARSDVAVRQSCAHNFPAVLKVAGTEAYATQFHDTFALLATDEDDEVRKIISCQFHEVIEVLMK